MANEAEELKKIQAQLRAILNLKSTIRDLGAEEVNTYKETLKLLEKENGDLKQFQQLQKQINRDLIEAKAAISGIRDAFAASVNELTGMNAGLNRAKKSFRGLESLADKLSNDQADISRLSLKELKTIEEKVRKRNEELKVAKFSLTAEIDNLKSLKNRTPQQTKQLELKKAALNATQQEISDFKNGIGLSQALIDQAKKRIEAENEIIKTMGMAPAILEGVGKALQKIGLPDFGVSEAVTNAKDIIRLKNEEYDLARKIQIEATKENLERLTRDGATKKRILFEVNKLNKLEKTEAKRVSSTKALGIMMGEVGKKIKAQLTTANLIQLSFQQLVAAMIKIDKLTGEQAKNLGISYDESLALQKNFTAISKDSDSVFVNTRSLNESFTALNQRFQGATGFSNELLESFTELTNQAGFSAEAIGNIAVLTGTQGDELKNNVALMQGQLAVMNAQEGTSFSEKQLLEDIGKISKATLLTLRAQPRAIARTLLTSKKLALSFAEMESIASSLLDFEGSIQSELEAELLTGRDLNLEQARLLALKGDIAGASAEIAKQVGSAADFEKMNVIQQEALAKAAGLTREQLANSLMEREALAKLGGQDQTALEAYNRLKKEGLSDEAIANKLGDERLAKQLKSQSIQARFAASVEKLQEVFVDIGEALMPIVSSIANMVVNISKFVAEYSGLIKVLAIGYGIMKGMQVTQGALLAINTRLSAIKIQQNATDAAGNSLLITRAGLMNGLLSILGLQNAAIMFQLAKEEYGLTLKTFRLAAEETILGSIIAQGFGILKNIRRLAIENAARLVGMSTALATNAAVSFGAGVAIAVAAATAGYFAIKALANDMIDPPPGYGKRRLMTPEGTIALNDRDTVIAGTNLLGDDIMSTPKNPLERGEEGSIIIENNNTNNNTNNNNNEGMNKLGQGVENMTKAVTQLLKVNKQILNKETTFEMQGEKVGAGIAQSERKIQ